MGYQDSNPAFILFIVIPAKAGIQENNDVVPQETPIQSEAP